MRKTQTVLSALFFLFATAVFPQESGAGQQENQQTGYPNLNPLSPQSPQFFTPNQYRNASGAPGPEYYQNEADYKMDIEIDDKNQRLTGRETITYHNNSPDDLEFLWVQLDQNIRAEDAPAKLRDGGGVAPVTPPGNFVSAHMEQPFEGGFNITKVSEDGDDLSYTINNTMMRIDLPEPLEAGESYSFDIEWWYNINDHTKDGGRSGYEYFEEDGNYSYVIAQFFPRMAVYNDVEGWQNLQFWGSAEYALPFGSYEVNITVPADHVLEGTGELVNRKEVYSKEMMRRYERARKSYDEPIVIVTQEEAEAAEKNFSNKKKTWKLRAEYVRDFAFATSRKFILDMMAVKFGDRDVMAVSLYPKEGNPLWEDYSTKVVAHTLESYSARTFEYPYPKAVSVHAQRQGMEYPMICWNHGRPEKDGTYSDAVKFGMMSVIVHEIGHNYFPMIVNSDERNWGWQDEGFNSFLQYHAEQEYGEKYPEDIAPLESYPSRRGQPAKIVDYMKSDQERLAPIMSNPENVFQLGNNAYGKTAAGLAILRETVMGPELFDSAFKTYSQRWMFKHPTPEDFFRTMEDASAVELDWFWRGWFYSTDYVDIGIEEVKKFYITDEPTEEGKQFLQRYNITDPSQIEALYVVEESSEEMRDELRDTNPAEDVPTLSDYLDQNFSAEEKRSLRAPKYLYEISFNRPGGMLMPIIVEYTYADGTSEKVTYPVQIWRKNLDGVSTVLAADKELTKIEIDPGQETADVNTDNNVWTAAAVE